LIVRSEWRLHRQWYERVQWVICWARADLAPKDNLYRCLDKLLAHKAALFSFSATTEDPVSKPH
jgi:hypothetical protein